MPARREADCGSGRQKVYREMRDDAWRYGQSPDFR
jgi:hypothetical protein